MIEIGAGLNIFGLFLDIYGAYLIFKYGLPETISREGHSALLLEQVDENEITKAAIYDYWGRVGLWALIIGFLTQAIGNSTVFWG